MNIQPLDNLTVLILTFNEESNIRRTLESVKWAAKIIVVDSFSTDATEEIVTGYEQAEFIQNEFKTHAQQWNFGLSRINTEWVLTMDADYVLPGNAATEIRTAINRASWGYQANFAYCINGQKVRGSILPPRTVLFRTKESKYIDDGHTQRLVRQGMVDTIPMVIAHDDRKTLSRWCRAQISYAAKEAQKLSTVPFGELGLSDKIRRLIVIAPPLAFLFVFVFRGGFLSGWRGLYYALQRLTAECLLSLFLLDQLITAKRK